MPLRVDCGLQLRAGCATSGEACGLPSKKMLDVSGRIVADVYVNNANVAEVLAAEGYARRR